MKSRLKAGLYFGKKRYADLPERRHRALFTRRSLEDGREVFSFGEGRLQQKLTVSSVFCEFLKAVKAGSCHHGNRWRRPRVPWLGSEGSSNSRSVFFFFFCSWSGRLADWPTNQDTDRVQQEGAHSNDLAKLVILLTLHFLGMGHQETGFLLYGLITLNI